MFSGRSACGTSAGSSYKNSNERLGRPLSLRPADRPTKRRVKPVGSALSSRPGLVRTYLSSPPWAQARMAGSGGQLDFKLRRDCPANRVAHGGMRLGPFDDFAQLLRRRALAFKGHADTHGLRPRRHPVAQPENAAIIGRAVDRHLDAGKLHAKLRGPHGDDGRIAVGQGRTQKPARRGRAPTAADGFGHVGYQRRAVGPLGPAHQAVLNRRHGGLVGYGALVRVVREILRDAGDRLLNPCVAHDASPSKKMGSDEYYEK